MAKADAHSAVAFSFEITHEGWDVNFDREVLRLVMASGLRSLKRRFLRFQNHVRNGIYPASPESLWAMVLTVALTQLAGFDVPLYRATLSRMPGTTLLWQSVVVFLLGLCAWLISIYVRRYLLKLLLMYKGWLFEKKTARGKVSLQTQLWALSVKVLSGTTKRLLYSYQGSLPRLPLPSLHDTLQRFLRSVRPILDDEQYKKMEEMATEFENGIGVKCQRYLMLKSWFSANYVSDWWEEYVYLRGRSPLMVNSNFYGLDAITLEVSNLQAARAAVVIDIALRWRRMVERQELEPVMIQNLIPLCSLQYERMFNTTRVPGVESDKLVHYEDSKHIVVYHRGRFFKVMIYHNNRLLKPCEIELQIQAILDDTSSPAPGEEKLASLTAGSRVNWAEARQKFFFKGINRTSLDAIEKAAFFVALDDVPYEVGNVHFYTVLDFDEDAFTKFGRQCFHGNGCDRWYDKSFTLCIGKNGRIGFNAEHTWADAGIVSHFWEFMAVEDGPHNNYAANGHTQGTPEFEPPKPTRLQWDLEPAIEVIEKSYKMAQELLNDVDLRLYPHKAYGKGFIKTCGVSPDAFIQMAIQLAYYRDFGRFSLTYEASMTRLYRDGRTETVRSCTVESSAWVRAMDDPNSTVQEKVDLLKKACLVHQRSAQDAMIGKGIDRHLFCLYVVSKYLEVDSPFLKAVLSEPWRLSTSQTPHGQTKIFDAIKNPTLMSGGGGFGPVADDGYGISYVITGEQLIFFHISSKIHSPETNSRRMVDNIKKALEDMRNLFLEYQEMVKNAKA